MNDYKIIDWILGEEGAATSSFDEKEQSLIQDFLFKGGKLFISGSEIGYDLFEKGNVKDKLFYEKFLRAEYKADAAGGKQGNYNIIGTQGSIPDKPQITALYPNPSNQSITIEFKITKIKTIAYLTITDIMGREIHKMSVQSLSAKKQRFNWNGNLQNGSEAPSGIYIANLSQDEHIVTKKFTLLK